MRQVDYRDQLAGLGETSIVLERESLALCVVSTLVVSALSSCSAQGRAGAAAGQRSTPAANATSPSLAAIASQSTVTATSGDEASSRPSLPAGTLGDADAIARCTTYQVGGPIALTVMAGYDTTVGAAYRYQDAIVAATGGPSVPPLAVEQDPNHTSTAPAAVCVLGGVIDGPGNPGVYSRELVMLRSDGTGQPLALSNSQGITLRRP